MALNIVLFFKTLPYVMDFLLLSDLGRIIFNVPFELLFENAKFALLSHCTFLFPYLSFNTNLISEDLINKLEYLFLFQGKNYLHSTVTEIIFNEEKEK